MAFIAPLIAEGVAAGAAGTAGAVAAEGAAAATTSAVAAEGAGVAAAGGEGAVGGLGGQMKNLSMTQFGGGGEKKQPQAPTTPVGGTPNDFNDPGYVG